MSHSKIRELVLQVIFTRHDSRRRNLTSESDEEQEVLDQLSKHQTLRV
jgi:hypothetical protein